ncbi:MAG: cell division protein FtsB [Gammaproteobacteria bacterium]|nr:cell division protein FtsB [Gammaproteobacteria bacterium]
MRLLTFVLVVLLAIVQFQLWVGEDSLAGVWRLEQAIKHQSHENVEFRQRNQHLAAEVQDLKTGLAAVEERARRELGMVREDETYYQIVDR